MKKGKEKKRAKQQKKEQPNPIPEPEIKPEEIKKEIKKENSTKMTDAIYNKETMSFMVKPAAEVTKEKKEYTYLSLSKKLTDELLDFATKDGIDMTAETPQGVKVRQTNAIKMYTEIALMTFIDTRNIRNARPAPEAEVEVEAEAEA